MESKFVARRPAGAEGADETETPYLAPHRRRNRRIQPTHANGEEVTDGRRLNQASARDVYRGRGGGIGHRQRRRNRSEQR